MGLRQKGMTFTQHFGLDFPILLKHETYTLWRLQIIQVSYIYDSS